MNQYAEAGAPKVFKPSLSALKNGPLGIVAVLLVITAAATYRRIDAASALVVVLVGLVLLAGLAVMLFRARLEVRPGEVIHRRVLGFTRIESHSLDRIVWIPALQSPLMDYMVGSRVVGVDRTGKSVFKLTSRIWSTEAVVAVAQALASTTRVVDISRRVTVAEVKQIEPVALTWSERNWGLANLLFFLGIVVFFVALFGIFVLTSG